MENHHLSWVNQLNMAIFNSFFYVCRRVSRFQPPPQQLRCGSPTARPNATTVAPKLGRAPGDATPIGAEGAKRLVAAGDVRHVLQLLGVHGDFTVISWGFKGDFTVISWGFKGDFRVISW